MASLYIPPIQYIHNHHPLNPKLSIKVSLNHLLKFQEYKPHNKHVSPQCKASQIQEALECLSNAGPNNLANKPKIYGDILQECVYGRDFLLGQQIHASIIKKAELKSLKLGREAHCYCIKNDLVCDVAVMSSTVDMYANCERINVARKVFDYTEKRDLALWNTILAAYAEIGMSGETLSLFYQMQLEGLPPNVISWNLVILSLLRNERVNEAMDIFREMQSVGIVPNLITYTTIITALVRNGSSNEAITLFCKMMEEGIQPDILSISCILSASALKFSLMFPLESAADCIHM
ncbi:hypothetical protein ACET3Z_009385 [Daucus carota]